ncbi:hypothetical protein DYB32_004987 [Aphanomyces invadans]|uniref:Uncharacterized protein n=1 Tax=Aphanomyces invadans TaxID=157072 RepID=A0A418AVZ2_9STRA|nr:hypothetical protein DYB32_004987 [Aphanomyces invadans]
MRHDIDSTADDETELPPSHSRNVDESYHDGAVDAQYSVEHVDHGEYDKDDVVPVCMTSQRKRSDTPSTESPDQDARDGAEEPPSKRQRIDDSASEVALPHTVLSLLDTDGGPQTQAFESESLPMFESEQPDTQARDEPEEMLHTPVQPPRDIVPSTQWMKQSKNHRRLSGERHAHPMPHSMDQLEIESVPPPPVTTVTPSAATNLPDLEQRTVRFTLFLVQHDQKAQVIEMKYGQTFQDLQDHVLATMVPDRSPSTELHFAFDGFSLPQRHEVVGDWIQDHDQVYATIG